MHKRYMTAVDVAFCAEMHRRYLEDYRKVEADLQTWLRSSDWSELI